MRRKRKGHRKPTAARVHTAKTTEPEQKKKKEKKLKQTAENSKKRQAERTKIKMTTRRTTARTATTIEERIAEATRTATATRTLGTLGTATPTTFGIELELTGISRKAVSELLYNYLQSKEEIEIYCMDTFKIIDQQGRKWSVDYDGSIHGDSKEQVELVTPILTMEDLPLLKGLIETLKAAGAKSHDKLGCGLHYVKLKIIIKK